MSVRVSNVRHSTVEICLCWVGFLTNLFSAGCTFMLAWSWTWTTWEAILKEMSNASTNVCPLQCLCVTGEPYLRVRIVCKNKLIALNDSHFRSGAELCYFGKVKRQLCLSCQSSPKFFVACRKHVLTTRLHISHQNLNIFKSRCLWNIGWIALLKFSLLIRGSPESAFV